MKYFLPLGFVQQSSVESHSNPLSYLQFLLPQISPSLQSWSELQSPSSSPHLLLSLQQSSPPLQSL